MTTPPFIPELPEQRAVVDPGAPCIEDDTTRLSNADFAEAVANMAARLASHRLIAGDVVALMLPNSVELVVSLFACWRLGLAATPVNPAFSAVDAQSQLEDCGAKALVVAPSVSLAANSEGWSGERISSDLVLAPFQGPSPVVPGRPDQLALVIYTSGSTGQPKGVMLDHANVQAMSEMILGAFELDSRDHCLLFLPMFHVNALVLSMIAPLAAGGRVTITERFSASSFWSIVDKVQPTYFSAVPSVFAILDVTSPSATRHSPSIRFAVCGGAPMQGDLLTSFEERFGFPILEGYGLSETTVACTINPLRGDRVVGSVGPALPGVEIKVIGASGLELGPCEPGEVVVRGPNVMRGYLGREESTREVLRDGWLRTGDVGYLDANGYLYIVDRLKDLIIRGGENISPAEIERLLVTHPQVSQAAVVGRADKIMGEEIVAFVRVADAAPDVTRELFSLCREHLAQWKIPSEILVVDEIPTNPVGKIDKPQLRRAAARQSGSVFKTSRSGSTST